MHKLQFPPEPFGSLLGHAPGGVAIYSSDYHTAHPSDFPDSASYRSYIDDVYMGYKWQCVEFARRYLYLNRGYVFTDVPMAYDIFALRHVRRVEDDALLPLHAFANGSRRRPEPGALLIWREGGEFEVTGHVAIITEVLGDRIRLAEQNLEHCRLPEGQQWSRELPLRLSADGGFVIEEQFADSHVLGWMLQTHDATHAATVTQAHPQLFDLNSRLLADQGQLAGTWLNLQEPLEQAFVQAMGGHFLTADPVEQRRYLRMSATAESELIRATNELHLMFLHATDRVLRDDNLLARFNIPASLWPRLRRSWSNRRQHMITGRFDFCMTRKGLKVYEYNADSASCHAETGWIQGLWADQAGCREGADPGADLLEQLTETWKHSGITGTVHILRDRDREETYHALFMQKAMTAAGICSKIITGLSGLSWSSAGEVIDPEGEPIRCVWKTWAWETALDQIRAECEADDRAPPIRTGHSGHPVRLVDVLLRPEVMVYEPFWTLIPSNKAILPILWDLFPGHRYLLNSQFALTPELQASGYVSKPIAGRCGLNISLVDRHDNLLNETDGRFGQQEQIYQELWRLPEIDGYRVQVCAFSVGGSYGGSCVRVDQSLIITTDSDLLPLRVVPDKAL